jgi:hypothetical protein
MDPIIHLARNIMEGNKEAVVKILSALDIPMKKEELEKEGKDLFRCVF